MNNENILVFGGAGGIGTSVVKKYAENANVIIVDIDRENGEKLYHTNNNIDFFEVDITNYKEVENIRDKIATKYGNITHMISIAGGAYIEEFNGLKNLDIEIIKKSIELNLTSQINIVKEFSTLMEKDLSTNKSITLVSSINALRNYGLPAYSSAKSGLYGFMHSVVDELGESNIRINCISPGTVPTKRTQTEPKDFDKYEKGTSLGRLTTTEDIANSIYAISHLMTTLVGQNIVIDAGQIVTSNG